MTAEEKCELLIRCCETIGGKENSRKETLPWLRRINFIRLSKEKGLNPRIPGAGSRAEGFTEA